MQTPNFIECVKLGITRALDFNGRSRRREYWFFALATYIVSVVIAFVFPGREIYMGDGM